MATLSQPSTILMWVFSHWVGVTQLVSGFPIGGIAPCVAVYLVHLQEKGNSRVFYVAILVKFSPTYFFQMLGLC